MRCLRRYRPITEIVPDGDFHTEDRFLIWDDAASAPGLLTVTGDWGDASRGASITAPDALTVADRVVDNPSSVPDWWVAGATVLWDVEVLVLEEVGDTETALLRSNPVVHDATVDVMQLLIKLQRAAGGDRSCAPDAVASHRAG